MNIISLRIAAILLAVALLASAACDRGQRAEDVRASVDEVAASQESTSEASADEANTAADDQDNGEDEPTYYYSPFVVRIESPQFDTVSFKDVGLDRAEPAPHDPLLETISQAFVYEVSNHTDLNYEGEVVYDERILDPANHLYCGERHLYIDVWRSESPERWGYSMWSGCGESDNFAWNEVEIKPSEKPSLTEEVSPLAESIADKLAEASDANCFTKAC